MELCRAEGGGSSGPERGDASVGVRSEGRVYRICIWCCLDLGENGDALLIVLSSLPESFGKIRVEAMKQVHCCYRLAETLFSL